MSKKYVDLLASKLYYRSHTALTWAKRNCPSYISADAVQKNGDYYYRYYFGDERDQLWFALKWA